MAGLAASRPLATTSSVGAGAPPAISAMVCSVASASTIMMATSPSGRTRPATTMSNVARSSSETVGKATQWPSMWATRVAPIGPLNGRPDSFVLSDAALIATTSYGCAGSSARTVSTTCTSLRRPLTKLGEPSPGPRATTEDRCADWLPCRCVRCTRWMPGRHGSRPGVVRLAAQPEPLDERTVALDVGAPQVVEQPPTAAVHDQQAAPAVVVVLVRLEVLGQVGDPPREYGDLHLHGTRVPFVGRVVRHDLGLELGFERHGLPISGSDSPAPTASCRHAGPAGIPAS